VEKSLSLEIQIKKIFQKYFAGIPAIYPNMRPCAEVTDQGKIEGLFGKRCLSFPFIPLLRPHLDKSAAPGVSWPYKSLF
jgi:hypothetical protein